MENNWYYYPPDEREYVDRLYKHFRNHPIPSDEVIEKIGFEEVKKIDAKIKERLRDRELTYSRHDPKRVDYQTPNLFFTNRDFPNDTIVCVAGACMDSPIKRAKFTECKDDAKPEDYRVEYKKRVAEITNGK